MFEVFLMIQEKISRFFIMTLKLLKQQTSAFKYLTINFLNPWLKI